MRIGELSLRGRVTRDTIRFYERRGLLGAIPRESGENNYKDYPEDALTRLHMIRYMKGLGFTLAEVGAAIDPWFEGQLDQPTKAAQIREKLAEIEERTRELQLLQHALRQELVRLASTTPP